MNKHVLRLLTFVLFAMLVLAGCGGAKKSDKENDMQEEPKKEVVEKEPETKGEPSEDEEEPEEEVDAEKNKDDENTAGSANFEEAIKYVEETTEGEANVVYENTEVQTHESEGVSTTLNGYAVFELKDFHTDFDIPFDRETDGGVIIAEYTIENKNDEDAYFMTDFYIEYPGTPKYYNNYDSLLPKEEQIKTMLNPTTEYQLKAGESITGYYAYPFSPEAFNHILDLTSVTVNINTPHNKAGDVTSNFGKGTKFVLPLSDEGAEKASANKTFYEDKITYNNMGEKEMIKEKSDINQTEALGDAKITLEGYQFTNFTPNEVEAPRFGDIGEGLVTLTVKFLVENGYDENISIQDFSSKLTLNNGTQYTLLERMLLNYQIGDVIKPGETGEVLQIFLLDKEQYDKIWKDKDFEIELGPIKNEESKDISKGKKVEFTLP